MREQIDHWLTQEDVPTGSELLYRFTSAEGLGKTLECWSLRLNNWLKMNDPRERIAWSAADLLGESVRAVPPYSQDALNADLDRILRRGARIGCFTDDRSPESAESAQWLLHRGWARAGMWNRYAIDHCGACLVFDRDELLPRVKEANPALSGAIRSWGQVLYSDLPIPSLPLVGEIASYESLLMALDQATSRRFVATQLYGTKVTDWSSEREYRIIDVLWDLHAAVLDRPVAVPIGPSLKAVILGEAYPSVTQAELFADAPAGHTMPEVLRCTWHRGVPFLNVVV